MLVEQAREDALNMHTAHVSKMDGLRKHARKVSAKNGGSGSHHGRGHGFEGDV